MIISEIMTREVETIRPDASMAEAARKMRELNIGFLPVYGNEQIMGVLTDRDITVRGVALGLDPFMVTVSEIMTGEVVGCFDDETVDAATKLMNTNQIRRLVVADRNKNLVGVVALGDLALDALNDDEAGRVLQNLSWPARPLWVPEPGLGTLE
jgi:CBS domain-containing protein